MSRRFGRKRKRKLKLAMEKELFDAHIANERAEDYRDAAKRHETSWLQAMTELKRELPNWVGLAPDVVQVDQVLDEWYVVRQNRIMDFSFGGPARPIDIAKRTLHVLSMTIDNRDVEQKMHLLLRGREGQVGYALSHQVIPDTGVEWMAQHIAKEMQKVFNAR